MTDTVAAGAINTAPTVRAGPRGQRLSPLRRLWSLESLSFRQIASRLVFLGMILMVLTISAVCIRNGLTWVDKHFAGFLVNERMVPGNVGRYDWTGTRAGLKFPDKIVRANDVEVSSMKDLERVIRSLRVGDPITYTLLRSGRLVEVTVETMSFTWLDLLVSFGLFLLSGIAYLLIGATVFVMKPDTEITFPFVLSCFLLSIFAIVAFDVFSTHVGFVRLYQFANTFMPASFLHLSLVFPERTRVLDKHASLRVVPYVISTVLFTLYQLYYPGPKFLIVSQLVAAYAVLSAGAMTLATLRPFFRSSSVIARQRAKVILAGAAIALPIPALGRYLSLFAGDLISAIIHNNFVVLLMTIFPASIAYAIVKHNLFDVDVYIKRAVGYGIMTALVGGAYLSTQALMNAVILAIFGEAGERISPVVFALLVVLFFQPVNRRVQDGIDRLFFRKTFDYKETIGSVSNALTSMLNLDQIIRQVVQTVRKEMFIDTAGVVVLEPKKQACWTFFAGDQPTNARDELQEIPVAYDDPLLALVRQERALITKYDIDEEPGYGDVKDACARSLSRMTASMAVPLVYQGEVTGVLALGEKKSGQFYTREDIELLTTMANQAAVAIQNATAHEEVVRYAEELAASLRRIQILESIKTNLAKFVPRTVQELIEESPEAPSLDKREADVSVVFADITGYTRLSAQLELDQVNRLVERYFGAFLDEILKYGGDVNETAGDGLMVIFRDPDPHQHARAAVRAARGIQRRTREINAQLRGQFEPITMHVGVNSGIASVGATKIEGAAGTRWTYTASGPTTNIAARLAALGEGGAVVLSEETRRRLGDEFELKDLGLQSLKNVETPIRVYRLTGEPREPVSGGVD